MKKSIFLFFAAILCAMSISAANMKGGEVLYLQPNSDWTSANAWFAIYLCNGSSSATWVKMTKSGNYYMATVPTGDYKNVIFVRMNPSNTSNLDWGQKWNQTADLSFDQKKNCCTITGWDKSSSWSTYQPVSDASLTSSAANIFVGGQATLTAKLSSNTNVNTLKSTSFAISPNTGASISGNTFTATAEGTYTVTATVTYYPNGCTSLNSGLKTATATTTIVAEVPAEEVHDVTVSYLCGSTKVADPTTVNTVGVETPVKVTAPEIAKYTFANWTLGSDVVTTDALTSNEINITTKAGGSDFTLVANYEKAKLTYTVTVPAGTENCYLVGAMNGWDVENPIEMTKQGENVFTTTLEGVATTDEYKYLSKKGSWDYADVQDANRTWSAEDVVTAWKDPLATNVFLAGEMNGWSTTANEFRKAAKGDGTASIILNLTTGTYKFKIVDNGSWLGNNSTIDKTISGWTFAGDKGDCPLKATIAGDYTFTWAISTKKLSVTYPTICTITATANDAAMGTIAGAGDYGKGSTATLTATPNDGYLFVNWTKGGEIVATTQEYSFKVTEAVALVANFEVAPEEVHNVTVSYVCGSNKIADDQTVAAVGETSAKTAEAPEIWGYTFSSWTLGAGVTSADATANPISINIVAGASDYTLTANYTEIPKVKIYVVNNKKWSKVNVYGWKDGEAQGTPAWPGQDITANKETEKIAGFDVYSYSVVPGSYDNIIFNNNSGTQTETFKWTDGKYYYMDADATFAGETKEKVELILLNIPDRYITGNKELVGGEGWQKNDILMDYTVASETYSHIFTNLAAGTYQFRITDGTWEHTWGWTHIENTEFAELSAGDNDNNIKLTLTTAKTVTINYNRTSDKISIDGLTPATYSDITIKAYTEGAAPQIWWWSGGSKCADAEKTYTWETAPTMTAVAGEANWYEWTFEQVNDLTGISFKFKNATTSSSNFEGVKEDKCYDVRDITNAKTTACGVTPSDCLECSGIYLKGTFNSWGTDHEFMKTGDANVVTTTVNITSEGNYNFKVHDGEWLGSDGGTMARGGSGVETGGWTMEKNKNEVTLAADMEGDYVFTYTISTKKLAITFPVVVPQSFPNQPTTLYFYPCSDWKKGNERYAAYLYNNGADKEWVSLTDANSDGIYELANPQKYAKVIICRMDKNKAENKWENKWDQIESGIEIPNTAGDLNTCLAFWTNAEGNRPVSECTWVVPTLLTDANWADFVNAYNGKKVNALVKRTFKSGQNHSLCLPFNLPTNWLGEGAKAYQLSSIVSNSAAELELMATECETLYAGKPYIVVPVKGSEYEHLIVSGVTIQKATAGANTITGGGYKATFKAVTTTGGKTDGSKEFYIGANDGYLYNAVVDKLGLRAIIELTTTTGEAVKVRARVVTRENTTTGFENIVAPEGQTIKAIVNGQLVIIRGGEMYNIQGQVIR